MKGSNISIHQNQDDHAHHAHHHHHHSGTTVKKRKSGRRRNNHDHISSSSVGIKKIRLSSGSRSRRFLVSDSISISILIRPQFGSSND
mmetsp:Transcript_7691/g.8815  ORF Transcript_7691/g.8815 Transcript_7691/m.8815 type:complete len:88 (+) Transcript_7691:136-399(+)